jgi:hypothetical protein
MPVFLVGRTFFPPFNRGTGVSPVVLAPRPGIIAPMRWPRIGFNAATALSTLLFLASLTFWVRSYFCGDLLRHIGPDVIPTTSYLMTSTTGELSLGWYTKTSRDPTSGGSRYPTGFSSEHWDSRAYPLRWPSGTTTNALGFGGEHFRLPEGDDYTLVVPYYAITIALFALPLIWLLRYWRRRKALAAHRCPACGYDLRATPNRCPECGRAT